MTETTVPGRRRTATTLALTMLILSGLVLSGCAGGPPSRLSPPIPDEQLDLAEFVGKPCDLLRNDRVARRHLAVPGSTVPDPIGEVCRWNGADRSHPTITAGADAGHTLEGLYQQRSSFTFFEPTDITHYPAVHTTGNGRTPRSGICTTQVGVADNAVLSVTADYAGNTSSFSTDPCPDADRIASDIINGIRAAGG